MAVRESDPPARSWMSRLNPFGRLAYQLTGPEVVVDPPNPDSPLDPRVLAEVESYITLDTVFVRAEGEQLRRFLWDVPVIPVAVYEQVMVICVGYRDPISRGTEKRLRVRPELELFPGGRESWLRVVGHSQKLKEQPWRLILDRRQRLSFYEIATEVIGQPDYVWQPTEEHLQRNLVKDTSLIGPFIEYANRGKPSDRPRPETVFRYLDRGLKAIRT